MPNNTEEQLYTIQQIKDASQIDFELKAGLGGSAFISGFMGLAFASEALEHGLQAVIEGANGPAYFMAGAAGLTLLGYIALYIKEKVASNNAIKQIRENTGMTKEQQRDLLTQQVTEGNDKAIELFDYFYGEEKRKL